MESFTMNKIPGSFFLGGIWGTYAKSCTIPWGSSIRFYWEAPWIFMLGMHTSCSLGGLHTGWKSRELPRRHLWNWTTCTVDEKLGATQKWLARNLHNGWKNGWKWMKPHCLGTSDLPLPIHPLSNFLIISKCFYTSLDLAFEEDGYPKKESTN